MIAMKVKFDIGHIRYKHNRMRLLSHLRELHNDGQRTKFEEIVTAIEASGYDLSREIQQIRSTKIASAKTYDFTRAEESVASLEAQAHFSEQLLSANPAAIDQKALLKHASVTQHELFTIKERNQKFYNLEWRLRNAFTCISKILRNLAINRNSKRTVEGKDGVSPGEAD